VFSEDADNLSEEGVVFVKGNISEFVDGFDEKTHKDIWLVGGPTLASGFIDEGQIDEFIIFTMPVLLGEGIPLFVSIKQIPKISLTSIKKFSNGVIENHYKIIK